MWSKNNQIIHSIVTGAVSLSDGTNLNVGIQLNSFVYITIVGWYNGDAIESLGLAQTRPQLLIHNVSKMKEAPVQHLGLVITTGSKLCSPSLQLC